MFLQGKLVQVILEWNLLQASPNLQWPYWLNLQGISEVAIFNVFFLLKFPRPEIFPTLQLKQQLSKLNFQILNDSLNIDSSLLPILR